MGLVVQASLPAPIAASLVRPTAAQPGRPQIQGFRRTLSPYVSPFLPMGQVTRISMLAQTMAFSFDQRRNKLDSIQCWPDKHPHLFSCCLWKSRPCRNYGGVFYFPNDWYVSRGKLISKGWVGLNDGWGSVTSVLSLTVNGNNILAGICGLGVWLHPLSDVIDAVRGNGDNAPLQFSLSQNYPNPFNPSTVINYQLPVMSHVTLKVYDVLGREVKTLVNEREGAGTHATTFEAASLPSGVYFYRLQAGSFVQTRKLVLIK